MVVYLRKSVLQRELDPFPILEKIFHCKIYSSEHLGSVINDLDKSIEQDYAKIVITNGIISPYIGRSSLAEEHWLIDSKGWENTKQA